LWLLANCQQHWRGIHTADPIKTGSPAAPTKLFYACLFPKSTIIEHTFSSRIRSRFRRCGQATVIGPQEQLKSGRGAIHTVKLLSSPIPAAKIRVLGEFRMKKMLFASLLTLATASFGQNSNSGSAPSGSIALHPPGNYAIVNGTRLWYESEGSGQAIVLIPAGPGVSHGYFHPHLSALAKSRRVIYYDAFGTGKSDRAQDNQSYGFSRDVENVEGLRKALGLGKIDVLGHSYGGMVAQAYALRHPDSVRRLIIAD
jgi:hypothetical protein